MTCHIALSGPSGTVLLSDSQGSTDKEENHGFQKQFVGPDFLMGCAGNGGVIDALMQHLTELGDSVSASNAETTIVEFVRDCVRPQAQGSVEIILATSHPSGRALQRYMPSMLTRFSRRQQMAFLGSGAEFANRARQRDDQIGVRLALPTLEDMLVAAENYFDAANSSLTVDDVCMIGILNGSRAYLIADASIRPNYVFPALRGCWAEMGVRFEELKAIVQTIRGEINNARAEFSSIAIGELSHASQMAIEASRATIVLNRHLLQSRLTDYYQWYDALPRT